MKKFLFMLFCLALCLALAACGTGATGPEGAPGKDGIDGVDGVDGIDGVDGADGKSAYELALECGFVGTVEDWLATLAGDSVSVEISNDGYWVINGTKTDVRAEATNENPQGL